MLDQLLAVAVVSLPTVFAGVVEVISEEIRKHPYWRIGVLLFGVALSALTYLQISRSDTKANKERDDLQSQLNQIKKNTETPPQVVVNAPPITIVSPPPPPKTSEVFLDNFAGAYRQGQTAAMFRKSGDTALANIFWANRGDADANDAAAVGRIYVSDTPESAQTEKQLTALFKKYATHLNLMNKAVIPGGGREGLWLTATSEHPLTQDDIDQLARGQKSLYIFALLKYTDTHGPHSMQFCKALQPNNQVFMGDSSTAVWHFCNDYSAHH